MNPSTTQQRKIIHAILAKKNMLASKADIISSMTDGRSTHSTDLSYDEARQLIDNLSKTKDVNVSSKLMSKLFAMAHEIGWIKEEMKVENGKLKKVKDYSRVHEWVEKYGYLKKPLRQYTYKELPKLVSQFETHVYNNYLSKKE